MDILELAPVAVQLKPDISIGDFLVLAEASLRVTLDGEDPGRVARWARDTLGFSPGFDEVLKLRKSGASLRTIASATGLSKSTVANLLSKAAA